MPLQSVVHSRQGSARAVHLSQLTEKSDIDCGPHSKNDTDSTAMQKIAVSHTSSGACEALGTQDTRLKSTPSPPPSQPRRKSESNSEGHISYSKRWDNDGVILREIKRLESNRSYHIVR